MHQDLCLFPLDNLHLDLLNTMTLHQQLTTWCTLFEGLFVEVNPRSTLAHATDTEDCVFLHEPQKTRTVLSPLPVMTCGPSFSVPLEWFAVGTSRMDSFSGRSDHAAPKPSGRDIGRSSTVNPHPSRHVRAEPTSAEANIVDCAFGCKPELATLFFVPFLLVSERMAHEVEDGPSEMEDSQEVAKDA